MLICLEDAPAPSYRESSDRRGLASNGPKAAEKNNEGRVHSWRKTNFLHTGEGRDASGFLYCVEGLDRDRDRDLEVKKGVVGKLLLPV